MSLCKAIWASVFFLPACLPLLALVAGVIAFSEWRRNPIDWDQRTFLLAFGLLGGVAGLITGVAKDATIVNGLLTGLLGVITALLSYLFSKDSLSQWRPTIPLAVIVLVLNALMGLSIGGTYKSEREDFERKYAAWLLRYERVELALERAKGMAEIKGKSTPAMPLPSSDNTSEAPPVP